MTETKYILANMTECNTDQAQYEVARIFNTSKRVVMISCNHLAPMSGSCGTSKRNVGSFGHSREKDSNG